MEEKKALYRILIFSILVLTATAVLCGIVFTYTMFTGLDRAMDYVDNVESVLIEEIKELSESDFLCNLYANQEKIVFREGKEENREVLIGKWWYNEEDLKESCLSEVSLG